MRLNRFLAVVFVLALASSAEAQQAKKVSHIGFMSGTVDPQTLGFQVQAFRQGLRDLGYIERKNHLVEYRYAEGKQDRIPSLVAELVQLNPQENLRTFPPDSLDSSLRDHMR